MVTLHLDLMNLGSAIEKGDSFKRVSLLGWTFSIVPHRTSDKAG